MMRAKLSVIIPVLNAAQSLPACLGALMEGVEAGLIRELVVSDGGSSDATVRIAAEAGAVVIEGQPSRGGQLGRGAGAAAGEWLLFLHADSILLAGWSACVMEHMQTRRPAHFKLRFDQRGFAPVVVAFWANIRSRVFRLPYGDQGLLISRDEYDAIGGYRDIPLMEDVAMSRALGRRLRVLPMAVTTSAARYGRDGWLRRGMSNFVLLARYFAGADPERLAKRY
jgi:rSAM/selenodomain-associated transferase 2